MSMTTENSLQPLQRNGSSRWEWLRCYFPCSCLRRKVAPESSLPIDSDFMSLGRKGKRVIRVVHIDPSLNDTVQAHHGDASLFNYSKRVICDDTGYDSDTSNEDYWFSKWSRPLRTVKRFQAEHLSKQGIVGFIRNQISSSPSKQKSPANQVETNNADLKVISSFAVEQSSQIIHEASQEASNKISSEPPAQDIIQAKNKEVAGIVNLGFVDSPSDPESSQATVPQKPMPTNTKPLLYFIHGAGESADSWKLLMHFFAGLNYEVLALDLLGHGFSHTPKRVKSYSFKRLLGDVLNVFDAHISSGRKAVVIGHGYGCSFAVALSRQRSSNVTLLALLSSGGPTPLAPPVTWRRECSLPASLLRCFRTVLPCGMRRNVFYGPRGKSCLHESVYLQSLPTYVRHHLAVGQVWPEGDVAFHRKIAVPTLLVYGLKDKFVSLVEMCEMERTIPRAFLEVIPEAGHDIMSDVPDQLCKMLRKFLEHWQR